MRTIFTRRVILSSLAGALTLAVICSALVSWAFGAPHTSTPTQPTAHTSATAAGYQVVLAPPTGARRTSHTASGGLVAVRSTTTTSTSAATTTATDDGQAVPTTTPIQYGSVGSLLLNITLKNTGTTTWSSPNNAGYMIHCVTNCGIPSDWPTGTIAPGATGVVQPQMTLPVPFSSGTTDVQWVLEHNGVVFGSPINLIITQTVAQPVFDPIQDPQPWCDTPALWGMTQLSSSNTVTCTSAGTVLQTAGDVGPGLWLAKPPLTWNKASYRMEAHVHFDSVTPNAEWVSLLINVYTSSLCPYQRVDFSPGNGVMQYGLYPQYCGDNYSPSRVWTSVSSAKQDMDIGVIVSGGTLVVWVNGFVEDTVAYTGGSVALALGSAPGQAAKVTVSNFELDNNISGYTTYTVS